MRICYLNHDTRSNTGAGRFFNDFSAAVKKEMPGADCEVLTSENILFPNKLKLLLTLPVIRKIIKRCDVLHALDGWPYGVIAALASIGLGKKLIITAIGTGAVQSLYDWKRRWLMKWAYRRADQVVAVSNNTKREISKFLPELKIEVIPHGVDVARYRVVSVEYQAEAKKFQQYILSVGSLKKRKGFAYSVEAFAKISDRFPDLKYIIVGGGPEHQNLKFKIENLKLENRVMFLEHVHQDYVNALYQNAELFLLLPQDDQKDLEGFGLVFLEAAACGLPVIATKNTSAEDAVRDGKNGILVAPLDSQEAAVALEKILSDVKLRRKMSEESIKFAREMSWERTARAYQTIYQLKNF